MTDDNADHVVALYAEYQAAKTTIDRVQRFAEGLAADADPAVRERAAELIEIVGTPA